MSIKLDRWFVPGVGFVKEATVVKGPGVVQRVTLELNKITLPAPAKTAEPQPVSSPKSTIAVSPAATPSEPVASPQPPAATHPKNSLWKSPAIRPAG